MATTTPNLGLTLPIGSEKVSRQILNGNFSLIDTAYGTLNSKLPQVITVEKDYGEISAHSDSTDSNISIQNIPSGLTAVGVVGYNCSGNGYTRIAHVKLYVSNGSIFARLHNYEDSAGSISVTYSVLCI